MFPAVSSLVIFGQLFVASTISNGIPYDYGYDDGHRSPLLQLFDGFNVQDYILRDNGNNRVSTNYIVRCSYAIYMQRAEGIIAHKPTVL